MAKEDQVKLWRKLMYAVGSIPYSMCNTVIGFYLSIFLLEVAIVSLCVCVCVCVCVQVVVSTLCRHFSYCTTHFQHLIYTHTHTHTQLDPTYVLIIVFSGRVWDAITDPVVGFLCSLTKTRLGRLRPW